MQNRRVSLRNGIELETPVLIPSLSSVATARVPYLGQDATVTEPTVCSIVHSRLLLNGWEDTILLSAYDIHYDLVVDSSGLRSGFFRSPYAQPQLIVIDSGWYEKRSIRNGVVPPIQHPQYPWTFEMYQETIDSLDCDLQPLVVCWDEPEPESYESQIEDSQDFFGNRPHLASTILLKPPGQGGFHNFRVLSSDVVANLRAFDVVGVTDNELGDTILHRLVALATLRNLLNQAEVDAPIHVFGGLDPLYTPLMYAAGGEFFDGLGWLRYVYDRGLPLYRDSWPLLDEQIERPWQAALASAQLHNLQEIRKLRTQLIVFAHNDGDWAKILHGESHLKPVFERFEAAMGGLNGRQ